MLVLAVGAAVDQEQHRISAALHVGRRLHDDAMGFGAVLALRSEILGGRQLQLRDERVVLMGQTAQRRILERIRLARLRRRRRQERERPIVSAGETRNHAAAGCQLFD